ncbi:hypothetical protein SATRM34S_03208 [Streptomyces atroolivaceus]
MTGPDGDGTGQRPDRARAGVPVDRCLFVDDSGENVDAAVALGMTGVRFSEPADLHEPFGLIRAEA